ncbi:MAG: phosphoenolpyruvate hydrolase family protein [Candidatus Bathyarchaeia archaeon]
MAKRYTREEIIARLKKTVAAGSPIVIVSAGSGLVGKLEEEGGADLISLYNSGRFRHYGVGSLGSLLPVADGNRTVLELANEVLPRIREVPIIAGLCFQDTNIIWDVFFKQLNELGFSGVMNFPTVGIIDATSRFRMNLEESGFGYDNEVKALKLARSMNLFTIAYAFTADEARKMAEADVDMLSVHVGLTSGGKIGAKSTVTLEESVRTTNELVQVARKIKPDIIPITHGGPMESPETVKYVLDRTKAVGYLGATSVERLPIENAVVAAVKGFKAVPLQSRL